MAAPVGKAGVAKGAGTGGSAGNGGKPPAVYGGYVMTHRASIAADEEGPSAVASWIIPGALVGIGLVVRMIEIATVRPANTNAVLAAALAMLGIFLSGVGLYVGVLVVARFMGSELDTPGPLILKLLAVAAATAAVAVLLASFDKEPGGIRGIVVALHAVLVLYFLLLTWLLKLDLLEALAMTTVAMVIHAAAVLVVGQSLPDQIGRMIFYGS